MLDTVKSTSCVALALLNAQNIYAACEGDVPSLISMAIANKLTGQPPFQANPSKIDKATNQMVLAHCTLPFNMSSKVKLDTHYESGIGIALKSEIDTGAATILKTNGKRNFVASAKIVKNLNRDDLCRTQIVLEPNCNLDYFLTKPIGNHHIVIKGDYFGIISDYFNLDN